MRGVHIDRIMRELGWLVITRVPAKQRRARRGQRGGFRIPKSRQIERKSLTLRDGGEGEVPLYAVDGALGIAEMNDSGNEDFVALERIRTQRFGSCGRFRFYNQYRLPRRYVEREITVRLLNDEQELKRSLNRAENLRAIPPGDPDFDALYARRPDAESLNRSLEDSLFLKKAHSVGHLGQEADLLGFALMINSTTLAQHRARERLAAA